MCAHEMGDVQLALFLCRVIWGTGSAAERRLLEREVHPAVQQRQQGGSSSGGGGGGTPGALRAASGRELRAAGLAAAAAGDGADPGPQSALGPAEALCRWLLGDAAGALLALLGARPCAGASAADALSAQQAEQGVMTAAEAAQLLPLLGMLLPSVQRPPGQGQQGLPLTAQRLCELLCTCCLAAVDALQCHGMHAVGLDAALAACKAEALALHEPGSAASQALQRQAAVARARLDAVCALCLLPYALHAGTQQAKQGWRSAAQLQLAELQQRGLEVGSCYQGGSRSWMPERGQLLSRPCLLRAKKRKSIKAENHKSILDRVGLRDAVHAGCSIYSVLGMLELFCCFGSHPPGTPCGSLCCPCSADGPCQHIRHCNGGIKQMAKTHR